MFPERPETAILDGGGGGGMPVPKPDVVAGRGMSLGILFGGCWPAIFGATTMLFDEIHTCGLSLCLDRGLVQESVSCSVG